MGCGARVFAAQGKIARHLVSPFAAHGFHRGQIIFAPLGEPSATPLLAVSLPATLIYLYPRFHQVRG